MNYNELHRLGRKLFAAAMCHAEQEGETVTEDGRDEHMWQTGSARQLLEAATDYFDSFT